MKIFDCFMYFDEDVILDVRLNTLHEYVDYFIIVESCFTHKGDKRDLKFNLDNFAKFKEKIIYLIYDKEPVQVDPIIKGDDENLKNHKSIFNASYRENGQRNFIIEGIKNAEDNDIILVSDIDEIPNLENITYVNVDFSYQSLSEQLLAAGFDQTKSTIFTLFSFSSKLVR